MRYGLLSDVHASPGPTRLALDRLRGAGAERFVCLGDVVGYGPDPAAAIALLVEAGALVVRGNHDAAIDDEAVFADLNADAQAVLRRHREELADEQRRWLAEVPLVAREGRFVFVHSSLPEPGRYRYLTLHGGAARREPAVLVTVQEMAAALADEEVAFIGHSHVPAVYSPARGGAFREEFPARPVYQLGPAASPRSPRIVNVGSVALPRRGRATAVLVDDGDSGELRFVRL